MTDRHRPTEDLTVDTIEVRGLVVTRVVGEVDLVGIDLLREELDALVRRRPPVLVVDLSGVDLLGSLGIAALLETHHRAVSAGVELVVVANQRPVLRPLQLTRVDRLLTVVATLDDVVATPLPC